MDSTESQIQRPITIFVESHQGIASMLLFPHEILSDIFNAFFPNERYRLHPIITQTVTHEILANDLNSKFITRFEHYGVRKKGVIEEKMNLIIA